MGGLVWKILGAGGAVVAGMAANKLAEEAMGALGRDMRLDPKDPDTPVLEAVLVIVVTGTVAALARNFYQREVAKAYRSATGHLPKSLQQARSEGEIA